jgi:glycerol-3-phosphate cytidylyltransferase-like family protein
MVTESKKIITVLNEAIKVLEENKWIRGYIARDDKNDKCNPRSKKACQFCAHGAIEKTSAPMDIQVYLTTIDMVNFFLQKNMVIFQFREL